MKEQDAGQLGTDSPRETIQLVQKQAGIGLDPEPGEYQGETSYESFERRVFGFATDHLQFRLFPIFSNHAHRTLHPDGADQADDKAQTFDVHAVRSRFLQPANKVFQIERLRKPTIRIQSRKLHLTFGGQRGKLGSVLLPILAIKGYHNNFSNRSRLQAAHIDAVTIGIGSRNIEGFDPAPFAKQMLGHAGIECVG